MNQSLKIPTLEEARLILVEAEKMNPGPWVEHSKVAAQAAKLIASQYPGLDPSAAYILGYLHDIGRRAGVTGLRHTIDGYSYLMGLGFDDAAFICLTHSFPIKDVYAGSGRWDCSKEELQFVKDFLESVEYTIYDKLLQMCDALALPTGYCLIEKRLVDVALRLGVNPYTLQKWESFLQIQREFEAIIGTSIYQLLPGVIENTFGFKTTPGSLE